jgi:hypothetical protein
MSLPKMTTAVDNISKLDTRPNAVNGLTADELKAKFDKAPEDIKRFLNEVLIPALDGAITLDALGAVPETRRVNGKELNSDITIDAGEIPALAPDLSKKTAQELLDNLADGVSKAVPKTRKVAGKTLDADVTLDAASIDYAGAISGAANVKEALEALNAENDVAVFSAALAGTINPSITSSATFAEIAAAYDAKKQVLLQVTDKRRMYSILPLATFVPDLRAVFFRADANGYYMRVTLSYDASSQSNNWEYASGNINADAVIYGGKIGAETADSVATALDTLAVGNPLDMTADYTTSGATSVEQWATMAAAQTETEGATRPAPKYRVSAGRYHIADKDNLEAYDVSILDVPSDTGRVVLIKQINSDPYLYCSVYTATAPGATATNVFYLSTEESLLEFGDGKDRLLPEYSDKVAGGDYDKFLQLTLVGQRVFPRWKRHEAKDISFQNSMTEMGRASNVEEALDELYAAGTLDATELYETSGANSVVAWAGMADVQDATKYRVPSGTYRVRDVVGEGTCIEHIVTITDTTYEWDNGQFFRYRQVEDKYCGDEPCIIVEWNQFDSPGEKTTSLRYYGDDEEFIVNGVNKQWLPEVTNADNGKCLRVVNGEWAVVDLPTYDGGVS